MPLARLLFNRTIQRRALLSVSVLTIIAIASWPRVQIEYSLHHARESLEQRNPQQALESLKALRRLDPDRAEVCFLMARASRRLGQMDDVRRHLIQAAELGWPRELIQREEWLALAQSGQMSQAEPHLGELLQKPMGDGPEICEAFVEGYFLTYRFHRAMAILDAWQADYPQDPLPHVYRGTYREHLYDWKEARSEFEHALALAPQDVDVRRRLAAVLVNLHEYDQAAEQFRLCLEHRPDDRDLLCEWAQCLQGQAEMDQSRDVLTRVLSGDPRHRQARLAMGQLEHSVGNSQAALGWLEPLCVETPTDSQARFILAQALATAGRAEEAHPHFEFVAAAQREMQEVSRLLEAVRDQPNDPNLRFEIGIRLLKYDNQSHGAAWLRSALDIDPHHRAAHHALADYYATMGNPDLAAQHSSPGLDSGPATVID